MTNADRYLKDGVDVEELINDLYKYNDNRKCVTNEYAKIQSANFFRDFLQQPIKPTLTEDEKVILRNIDKKIKYITRDKSGYLYITEQSFSMLALPFSIYNHLFQFIQPRRRIFY